MRAVSLHRDVLVVTSALLHVNCVIVRGASEGEREHAGDVCSQQPPCSHGDTGESGGETFLIDSPVLPDELDALPALIAQARFPSPSGLLATHGDWDHLLGRLAYPELALGCAQSTATRLAESPGEAQRELRAFDEELMIERTRPLALGSVQALPVPGRCDIGELELELHPADGHTPDGMAVVIGWAGVLVVGDYLSTVELPTLNDGGDLSAYIATLERLHPLVASAEHVVPGHGPVLERERALAAIAEDLTYLLALSEGGERAQLPVGRATARDRGVHAHNLARVPTR
ncbi:MAG TPA: MBL fold metallo-hydrolase [Solirubrobacteraceae bacterium]|nr:MBL fold metallo-hydrolase [Solirubrobacteraceae bacterium]